MLLIIIISAIILLANEVMTTPATNNCGSVTSNQCYQLCNHSSCSCGEDEHPIYASCNQACAGTKCSKIICSSGICYQSCHNCHMECTNNVKYCKQQCLSEACTFTCNAKHCVKERSGTNHHRGATAGNQVPFPRAYLAILAGLFAAMTILSCLALTLSCSKMNCWHQRGPYYKLRVFSGSVESLSSQTSIA